MTKPNRLFRVTSAKWTAFDESGTESTKDIAVLYYPLTVRDLKNAKAKNEDDIPWLSDTLFTRLHALPDIEGGKAGELTLDFLDDQLISNLKSVFDAIQEHENPKSTGDSSPAA
ncbi:MAG TPA: hypothetical protein PLX39_17260 [Pyrinomonadaceae bacterium]|nr:hypothetical protein [Pyrinomonadaceae bacterium]